MMKKILTFVTLAAAFAAVGGSIQTFSDYADGDELVPRYSGVVGAVDCFSTNASGTVTLKRLFSMPVYTNAVDVKWSTNWSYKVSYSNSYTHAVWTNDFQNLSFVTDPWIVGITTNTAIAATTNRWPVLKEKLQVTNDIVSGTCSAKYYHGEPASKIYVTPGDRFIFRGTATGGSLRIIVE